MDDYKKGGAVDWGRKARKKYHKASAKQQLKKSTQDILKALEASGYNAKPGKLRQGTIMLAPKEDGTEHTEEELDAIWIATFGHKGYDDETG